MTLTTNPQHKLGPNESRNNGSFEKPSRGVAQSGYNGKIAYQVPEGKYFIGTIAWDNETGGFYMGDRMHGNQMTVGNWGSASEDRSVTRHIENVRLYAGMFVKGGSSTTASVFGCEYDL